MSGLKIALVAGGANAVLLGAAAASIGKVQLVAVGLASAHAALECASQRASDDVSPDDARLFALSGLSLFLVYLIAATGTAGFAVTACWALGIGVRTVAIRTLGPAFRSSTRPGGVWISRGIYRFLDHPSEVGLALCVVGATMFTMSGAAITAAGGALALTLARIRAEEAGLKCSGQAQQAAL